MRMFWSLKKNTFDWFLASGILHHLNPDIALKEI